MKMHVVMQVTALVDVDVGDTENMRYAVLGMETHGSSYLDDGEGGTLGVAPTLRRVMELSSLQVVLDGVAHAVKSDLDKTTHDVTLSMSPSGATA